MNTRNRFVSCALLLCALVIPCQAQQSDKLLSILKQELKSNLQLCAAAKTECQALLYEL